MAPLASEIIGLIRDGLRAEEDSDIPYLSDDDLIEAVSDANYEWRDRFMIGSGNSDLISRGETGYNIISDTAINESGGVAATDTEFNVDDSGDFYSSGKLIIWDSNMPDEIDYTANSANNFSGVTNISFDHDDDDTVQAVYPLPSDFASFRKSKKYGDGVRLNGTPLVYMEAPPTPGHFSLIDSDTKYLWLYRGASGVASIWYNRISSDINKIGDETDVPDKYKFFLVWRGIEFALFGRGDNLDIVAYARQKADEIMYRALRLRNTGQIIRTRPIRTFGNYTENLYYPKRNE